MDEYISRADVLAKSQIMNDFSWATGCGILTDVAAVPVIEIEAIPAADVRPVVLCKDCKWYKESELLAPNRFCFRLQDGNGKHIGYNFSDMDFCSYGERKEADYGP